MKDELAKIRMSYEEVQRERDMLKSHVKSMEQMVQQQIAGKLKPPPRPTSAPPRGEGGTFSPKKAEAKRKLTKEEDKELMKRLTGKAWAPDRDDPRSGVEQLKRKMEAQIKRDNEKQKEAAGIKKKDKRDLKSRKELEEVREQKSTRATSNISAHPIHPQLLTHLLTHLICCAHTQACEEMYKRSTERRKRLLEQMAKKAEENLPTHKKSSQTPMQRAMHFQRLSMPNAHSRVKDKQQYQVKGATLARPATARGRLQTAPQKPGWFAGQSRDAVLKKAWKAGDTGQYGSRTAVH